MFVNVLDWLSLSEISRFWDVLLIFYKLSQTESAGEWRMVSWISDVAYHFIETDLCCRLDEVHFIANTEHKDDLGNSPACCWSEHFADGRQSGSTISSTLPLPTSRSTTSKDLGRSSGPTLKTSILTQSSSRSTTMWSTCMRRLSHGLSALSSPIQKPMLLAATSSTRRILSSGWSHISSIAGTRLADLTTGNTTPAVCFHTCQILNQSPKLTSKIGVPRTSHSTLKNIHQRSTGHYIRSLNTTSLAGCP